MTSVKNIVLSVALCSLVAGSANAGVAEVKASWDKQSKTKKAVIITGLTALALTGATTAGYIAGKNAAEGTYLNKFYNAINSAAQATGNALSSAKAKVKSLVSKKEANDEETA